MSMDKHVFEAIRASALEVVPELDPVAFTGDATLAELGCNSIDRADIVTLAMERLGVTVPISRLHQGQRIAELVALFGGHG